MSRVLTLRDGRQGHPLSPDVASAGTCDSTGENLDRVRGACAYRRDSNALERTGTAVERDYVAQGGYGMTVRALQEGVQAA